MSRQISHWMPIYWGDYHADTGHLSAGEHGAYLLLIGHYWTTGKPLPWDHEALARIARMTTKEWKKSRDTVLSFFELKGGFYHHKRVDHELKDCEERAKKAAEKATKAAQARWKHSSSNAPSMPQAMHEECPLQPQAQKEEEGWCVAGAGAMASPLVEPAGFSLFWTAFPAGKRGERAAAAVEYCNVLTEKRGTEEEIHAGVRRYVESDEIARKCYSRADNWLRRDSWKNDYSAPPPRISASGNGKNRASAASVAAELANDFARSREVRGGGLSGEPDDPGDHIVQ